MEELLALINTSIEDLRGQEIVRTLKLVETLDTAPEDGPAEEEDEYYLENRDSGIEIHLDARRIVRVVLLYAEGYEGAKQYPGSLLHDLTFASSRKEVLKRLGQPNKTIDGSSLAFLGEIGTVDRFSIGQSVVLFQFKVGDGGIDVITMTAPES